MKIIRGKGFKLDDIRRILEIISTNRVQDENELLVLSKLLEERNISSNNKHYQHLVDSVNYFIRINIAILKIQIT